ncbi:taste receptor type 2 member 40-like [Hyperolius riggenbachi]|uniref:taste receptor type 2 member 40-like n=1 Tax=Hyperolius riggenbachi TaxID=752182 RepID=UPI0035A2F690
MEVLLTSITITLLVLTWLAGVMLNSSIVAVYFRDLINSRHFSVCDKIFISTAILNIVQQCSNSVSGILCYLAFYLLYIEGIYALIFFCNCTLIYGSFWYSAWLSIFYFLKLVKCSQRFFLLLKKILSSSTVQILIMTMLGMVFINVPFIWAIDVEISQNETTNQSGGNYQITMNMPFIAFNLACGCCLPLLATLICIGLSVASLLGQVWRVHQNVSQFSSLPQIQGLLRAARTMTLQLILNTVLGFGLTINSMFLISSLDASFSGVIVTLIIMSFPSAQAMTLILGNPKLCKRLFCQALPT